MIVRVKYFAYFRELFGARDREMSVPDAATVKDILETLCDTAERRNIVFDGCLKPNVVVMKNGSSILSLGGLATSLSEGDAVAIFPMLGGG
jgi:sulfur-carrier protein